MTCLDPHGMHSIGIEEQWSPVHTPFWLTELEPYFDQRLVTQVTEKSGLYIYGNIDDPSIRGKQLSFWLFFRLRLVLDHGPLEYSMLQESRVLDDWIDLLDSLIEHRHGGRLSRFSARFLLNRYVVKNKWFSQKEVALLSATLLTCCDVVAKILSEQRRSDYKRNNLRAADPSNETALWKAFREADRMT